MPNRSSKARLGEYCLFAELMTGGWWRARVLNSENQPYIWPTLEVPFTSEVEAQLCAENEARSDAEHNGSAIPIELAPKWEAAQSA